MLICFLLEGLSYELIKVDGKLFFPPLQKELEVEEPVIPGLLLSHTWLEVDQMLLSLTVRKSLSMGFRSGRPKT